MSTTPSFPTTETSLARRAHAFRVFSTIASAYPRVTRLLSFGRDQQWKRALLDLLPEAVEGPVVDLACGNADLTIALRRRYPRSLTIGIDFTPAMLTIARHRIGARDARLSRQDMQQLAVANEVASVLTGGYALRNAPDLGRTLDEIRRILKPGGVAGFIEFSRSANPIVASFDIALLSVWGWFWGLIIHGNPRMYGYIAESLLRFPDRKELHEMFKSRGFAILHSGLRMAGMIEILVVRKEA